MAEPPIRYAIPAALAAMRPERHHVVEASAGTGKTYLIEHRVVDLLLTTDALLEQILVVTFTERATAELRLRLRRLLERVLGARDSTAPESAPAWLVDREARRRLTDALYGFDRAAVYTIHAFCQRVLTENAFANRRLFEQTQIARESAFAAAFKALLRERLARDVDEARYLSAWLRSAGSVDRLARLLFECSRQGGRLAPRFDAGELGARIDAVAGDLASLDSDALEQALAEAGVHRNTARAVLGRVEALRPMVATYRQSADIAQFLADVAGADASFLANLRKLGEAGIRDPGVARAADRLAALARAIVSLHAAVAHRFLEPVVARMQRDKDRHGYFDFDDMLGLVWQSLEASSGSELARRLRARYRHALIDEFQDTDELQWKIFRRLYLESDGESLLTIIGDPKQAIYGFRGADVFTYFAARREMLEAGAQETVLDKSYRATAAIAEAHNRLFLDGPDGGFFTGEIRYPRPIEAAGDLAAHLPDGRDVVPIAIVQAIPTATDKLPAREQRQICARFIRDELRALLGDPERSIAVGPADDARPIEPRDIFVLTRTGNESNEIAGILRDAAIPCALYKQEGLLQTAEAAQVRDLLAGIAQPRSRSARLRALSTRFFGVELADLPRYAELADAHPFVTHLYSWRSLADKLEYEELFHRIVADSGVVERELFAQPCERALTNYLHLFELLLEETSRSRCDLGELVQRLQQWIDHPAAASAEDRNVQRLESERSAVQIMTIHKAKGLEAKVVFLYGGFGAPPPGLVRTYHRDGERLVCVGKADGETAASIAEETAQEDQRLLYVALTRAVARLYLPYVDPEHMARRSAGTLAQLGRRLGPIVAALAQGDADLARRFELVRARADAPSPAPQPDVAPAPAAREPWAPPRALLSDPAPDPALERIRAERRGFVITSYTRLKSKSPAQDRIALEPRDFDEDVAAAEPPEDDLPGGAETGIFLHEVLERLDFGSALEAPGFDAWRKRPEIAALFAEAMLRHDRHPRHLERAQRIVFDCLTTRMCAGGFEVPCLAACNRTLREVEFLYPLPDGAPHGFVKGFIDLVFEAKGRVYALDWKSDILPSYAPDAVAEHVAASYCLQAELYALALAKMVDAIAPGELEARFGGLLFCFLRGVETGGPPTRGIYFDRPSRADLRGFEGALARRRDYW